MTNNPAIDVLDGIMPSNIREDIQRLQAERVRLAADAQMMSPLAHAGDAVARDQRAVIAERIAELDRKLATANEALPFAEAREKEVRRRDRDVLVALVREQLDECARETNELVNTLVNSIAPTTEAFALLRLRSRQRDDLRA